MNWQHAISPYDIFAGRNLNEQKRYMSTQKYDNLIKIPSTERSIKTTRFFSFVSVSKWQLNEILHSVNK